MTVVCLVGAAPQQWHHTNVRDAYAQPRQKYGRSNQVAIGNGWNSIRPDGGCGQIGRQNVGVFLDQLDPQRCIEHLKVKNAELEREVAKLLKEMKEVAHSANRNAALINVFTT